MEGLFAPLPGDRIGRFEVVRVIGEGAMGVVLEAIDPMLGRRVALKLLHPETQDAVGSARLLREAQALARLSHPNVVTVYEAGLDDERVFLAMEMVEGMTARAWCAARSRTAADICGVFRQAAVGLAAAHRAGLVHRDVKPDNILVGDDGRVRITDFGLVAAETATPVLDAKAAAAELGTEPITELTRTGMVLGTPGYMPPEAHLERTTDALGDQFALCVAWWEALSGVRPFAGETYRELVTNMVAGASTCGRDAIEASLRAVLERGLAADRTERWPSIAALLDAIDGALVPAAPRPSRRRVARLVAGTGVLATAGIAVAVVVLRSEAPAPDVPQRESAPVARPLLAPGGCPYMPAFADDDTVVYDDARGDLWTVALANGAPRRLTDGPAEEWRAARGRRPGEVMYLEVAPGTVSIAARDLATGTTERFPAETFAFAAAGDAIVYGRTDVAELRRRTADEDARLLNLPDNLWHYAISSSVDGRRIAITTHAQRSRLTVCVAELDGGSVRGAIDCLDRTDVIMGRAALTPDGATLYYQTEPGIRRRVLATGHDELWLPGAYAYGGMEVSRDGRTLVFADSNPREIRIAPLDDLEHPAVEVRGSWADAAKDGRWVYVRWSAAGHELVEQAADGTRRVLASGLGRMQHPSYDPTGTQVAFEVDGDRGGIWIVDARAYPPIRITEHDSDSSPVWLLDGRIAFTRWDQLKRPNLVVADPERGTSGDATRQPVHPLPRATVAHVFATGEILTTGSDAETLYAWDPRTGRERVIPLGDLPPIAVPSPDGRWLAVLGGDRQVFRAPYPDGSDGRTTELVWKAPPCGEYERPVWDASGRLHVAYRPWAGNVYAVDLVD